ncbi:MAG: tetratricopeptide repeat protein [Thermomicrobiales bacterium]
MHIAVLKPVLTFLGKLGIQKASRDARAIRAIQAVGLKPGTPPSDFDGVYAYTLAEYGASKPDILRKFFADNVIKEAFHQSLELKNVSIWYEAAEGLLEQPDMKAGIRQIEYDPRRDYELFVSLFDRNLDRTLSLWQRRQDHKIDRLTISVEQIHQFTTRLLKLTDTSLSETGAALVKPARLLNEQDFLIAKTEHSNDLYFARAVDSVARETLDSSGAIIIVGRPTTGKTRLAWHLTQHDPNALVILPITDEPPEMFNTADFVGKNVFIIFDDLHETAESCRPLSWWARFDAIGVRSLRLICVSRDSKEWKRLESLQGRLLTKIGRKGVIFTSRVGQDGRDIEEAEGWGFAQQLGIAREDFDRRFDRTLGSLFLDITAMRQRYERLRDDLQGDTAMSRLLDAAKLLYVARQPQLRESVLRAVSEQIIGDGRFLGRDVWDRLKRLTDEEAFGEFLDEGNVRVLRTYRPYLEVCVAYQPTMPELRALTPVLQEERDGEGLFYLGVALNEHGQTDEAMSVWRSSMDIGDGRAASNIGVLLMRQGLADEAVEAWRAGLALGYDRAAFNLGVLFDQQGKTDEAMEAFRTGMMTGDGRAASNLGVLLKRRGLVDEAIGALLVGVALGHGGAAFNLGGLLDEQGSTDEAIKAYRMGMALGHGGAALSLGFLHERQGKSDEAIKAWRTGITHGHGESGFSLGVLLERQGKTDEATEAYRTGMALGNGKAASNLGALLSKQGKTEDAADVLRAGIALGDGRSAFNLGVLLDKQGKADEAVDVWRTGMALGDGASASNLGVELAAQGKSDETEEAYRKGVMLGSDTAAFNLGMVLNEQGKVDEAIEAYSIALAQGIGVAAVNLGRLLVAKGKTDEAKAIYRTGMALGAGLAANNLGILLNEQGKTSEAIEAFRAGMALGEREAAFNLGVMLAGKSGHEQEAEGAYQKAIAGGLADAKVALGAFLTRQPPRRDEGCQLLRQAVDEGIKDAEQVFRACCG